MPDFAYYRVYLQAGLREAERYLLSNELFWPLNIMPGSDQPGYPYLTAGGLLLYARFARGMAVTPSQQGAFRKIEIEIEALQTRWQVAWEKKTAWEFESRLRQWGNVLKDIRVDPEDNIPYYRYEVRLRVLLDLLEEQVDEIDPALQAHLDSLDILLRALFKSGDFIWATGLASSFPVKDYWYLWGTLKEP